MKIIAECGELIMAVDDNAKADELTRCRVYNLDDGKLAPDLPAGSWTARVFPWVKPSRDYKKELKKIEEIIETERKLGKSICYDINKKG